MMKRTDTLVAGILTLLLGAGVAVSWADVAPPLNEMPQTVVAMVAWILP